MLVCVWVEDTDPTPVDPISWCKVVCAPNRPFGQKTNLLSQHHQPQEERQVRPGHFWLLKFGKVAGSNSCVEKKFKLGSSKYEEYKGVRFGNGDCALMVDVWLHRVDEDASGLTFEEWDPSADTDASEVPVAMIVNSFELCATGFDLREVIPLQLDAVSRGDCRTRGAVLKQTHGMGTRRYLLSVDNDNEFMSRCE
jgi:hypothetical protein